MPCGKVHRQLHVEVVDYDVAAPPKCEGVRMLSMLGGEPRRSMVEMQKRAVTWKQRRVDDAKGNAHVGGLPALSGT